MRQRKDGSDVSPALVEWGKNRPPAASLSLAFLTTRLTSPPVQVRPNPLPRSAACHQGAPGGALISGARNNERVIRPGDSGILGRYDRCRDGRRTLRLWVRHFGYFWCATLVISICFREGPVMQPSTDVRLCWLALSSVLRLLLLK